MTLVSLIVAGCDNPIHEDHNPEDPTQEDPNNGDQGSQEPVDYREVGSFEVTTSSASINVNDSCTMDVSLYEPVGESNGARIILAHGFARGKAQMDGWARHFASWGTQVATPDLCHASLFDVDHAQNAEDLIALNEQLGGGPVVYAGHSAGGLAAIIAAINDDSALAAMGLDTTDADGLGANAATGSTVPIYGLLAEPNDCNSNGNGEEVYNAANNAITLRITEADHCDFENETDGICTTFCNGTNDFFSDEEIQDTITGLLTAAAVQATGFGQGLSDWWEEGGGYYEALATEGAISTP